jgi:hypothetical protein
MLPQVDDYDDDEKMSDPKRYGLVSSIIQQLFVLSATIVMVQPLQASGPMQALLPKVILTGIELHALLPTQDPVPIITVSPLY